MAGSRIPLGLGPRALSREAGSMLLCCLGPAAHGMPRGCCAGRAVVVALALLLSHAACELNASVQHVTYDAADLSVAKQALSDGLQR